MIDGYSKGLWTVKISELQPSWLLGVHVNPIFAGDLPVPNVHGNDHVGVIAFLAGLGIAFSSWTTSPH
jgi:hypothetical protein